MLSGACRASIAPATTRRLNVTVGLLIALASALELWFIHYDPAPYDGRGPALIQGRRHARACRGHPRLGQTRKAWMAGTSQDKPGHDAGIVGRFAG
jgi:hypothetical protein